MIFDSDILIWYFKRNEKAALLLNDVTARTISTQTYMEIMQGARSKVEQVIIRETLKVSNFRILALTDAIGHRATIYIEEYALSHGLRSGDALIAATAFEYGETLATGNAKHFQCIPGLELEIFKP